VVEEMEEIMTIAILSFGIAMYCLIFWIITIGESDDGY